MLIASDACPSCAIFLLLTLSLLLLLMLLPLLRSDIASVTANDVAFAAIKFDGSVVAFGPADFGGHLKYPHVSKAILEGLTSQVSNIYSTSKSFAAVRSDGTVWCWGAAAAGGEVSTATLPALRNVAYMSSNKMAFAAVLSDASVLTFGSTMYGGGQHLKPGALAAVYANAMSFAALTQDRRVIAFGNAASGGTYPNEEAAQFSGVLAVVGNAGAFAALNQEGHVNSWGMRCVPQPQQHNHDENINKTVHNPSRIKSPFFCIPPPPLPPHRSAFGGANATHVKIRYRTHSYAPTPQPSAKPTRKPTLASDREIGDGWGDDFAGDDFSQHKYRKSEREYANMRYRRTVNRNNGFVEDDFTAGTKVKVDNGGDDFWMDDKANEPTEDDFSGDDFWGDDFKSPTDDFETYGVAAGDDRFGRHPIQHKNHVIRSVYATNAAFAALSESGRVFAWGDSNAGGNASAVDSQLKGVRTIYTTWRAFAALTWSGEVVTWGCPNAGGDSTAVQHRLFGVKTICSNKAAFVAIKSNGDVITWGSSQFGGDTTQFSDLNLDRFALQHVASCSNSHRQNTLEVICV